MSNLETKVLVCVPTFKRPQLLSNLLASLARQTGLEDPGIRLSVAVFDNDPAQSARAVVAQSAPFPVRYIPVPEPGLAAVRNQAIALAKAEADFMAFLDDDEQADETWLAAFLAAYKTTSCKILCGRNIPTFEPGPHNWVLEAGFFNEKPLPPFVELPYGHTGNSFLSCALFHQHAIRFDPALSFSGGEDLLFFARLQAAGETIRYVPSAIVREMIPTERTQARFLLQRAFRSGGTLFIVDVALAGWLKAAPLRLARAGAWLLQGLLCAARDPLHKAGWLRCGLKVSMAAGTLGALFGFQVQPYAYGRKKR